jgi:hypothetical protein
MLMIQVSALEGAFMSHAHTHTHTHTHLKDHEQHGVHVEGGVGVLGKDQVALLADLRVLVEEQRVLLVPAKTTGAKRACGYTDVVGLRKGVRVEH